MSGLISPRHDLLVQFILQITLNPRLLPRIFTHFLNEVVHGLRQWPSWGAQFMIGHSKSRSNSNEKFAHNHVVFGFYLKGRLPRNKDVVTRVSMCGRPP